MGMRWAFRVLVWLVLGGTFLLFGGLFLGELLPAPFGWAGTGLLIVWAIVVAEIGARTPKPAEARTSRGAWPAVGSLGLGMASLAFTLVTLTQSALPAGVEAPPVDRRPSPLSRYGFWLAPGMRRDSPPARVYVMAADGAGKRALSRAYAEIDQFEWSPDGTEIALRARLWDAKGGNMSAYLGVLDTRRGRQTRHLRAGRPTAVGRWQWDGQSLRFGTPAPPASGPSPARAEVTSTHYVKPQWSPDGRWLLFESTTPRSFVVKLDGSKPRRLANGEEPTWSPGRSPDGKHIASLCSDASPPGYYISSGGGGYLRLVHALRLPYFAEPPAWAPDSKWLLLAYGPYLDEKTLYVVEPRTGASRDLVGRKMDFRHAAWSPDGSLIAFIAQPSLYVIRPDGRGVRKLAGSADTEGTPSWSPDSRRVVFAHDGQVLIAAVDGTGTRRVAGSSLDPRADPAWSPDSRWVAYASGDIWIMRPDGSGAWNVTNLHFVPVEGTATTSGPGQGSRLVLKGRAHQEDIWVVPTDGTAQRNLTNDPAMYRGIRRSPDGTKVAFTRLDRKKPTSVWVVNLDGSGKVRIAQGTSPDWSPDGRALVYLSSDAWTVCTANIDGTGERRVGSQPPLFWRPSWSPWTSGLLGQTGPEWSPDGRRIAFTYKGDGMPYGRAWPPVVLLACGFAAPLGLSLGVRSLRAPGPRLPAWVGILAALPAMATFALATVVLSLLVVGEALSQMI
jgi:Tol biopolymer transport system component